MNADDDCKCTEKAAREAQPDTDQPDCAAEDAASADQSDNVGAASTLPRSKTSAFTKAVYYWVLSRF